MESLPGNVAIADNPSMAAVFWTFLLQVYPARFEFMTERDVRDIVDRLKQHWPEHITVTTKDDDGRCVIIAFESNQPDETWGRLKRSFVGAKLPGSEFRKASVITVMGDEGWNDFLLLHHYDETKSLDRFPGDG